MVKGSDGWLFGMGWVEVEVVVKFGGRQALVGDRRWWETGVGDEQVTKSIGRKWVLYA